MKDDIRKLKNTYPLMEPTLMAAIRDLYLPLGSRGLDAGCGIGLPALLLADEVGPTGQVIGLDHSPELIHEAEQLVAQEGMSDQINLQDGDIHHLPFDEDAFEWVWSSSCVGYAPSIDPYVAVQEFARVVKPGGTIAILAWSSEKLLPGYPLLEARLNATTSGLAPFGAEGKPDRHFMRALGWFRRAGLKNLGVQTFVGDLQAPLKEDMHQALVALFAMRWGNVALELPGDLYKMYQKICLPESEEFIVNDPDYCAFFTLTLFTGFL